ncbi:MAG: hypothetical protein JSV86_13580, partial [Gemmatimonadota bacterium]
LEAVKDAAADEFEVFGEIGRGDDASTVYLARDRADQLLVVLRLEAEPGAAGEYSLDVVKQLDASLPGPGGHCPSCGEPPRRWRRFCTACGHDLLGAPWMGDEYSREETFEAVREAAEGAYEILGEMPLSEGAGVIYFGRDIATGGLTALRLRLETSGDDVIECSLGPTTVWKRPAGSSAAARPNESHVLEPHALEPVSLGASPAQEYPAPAPARSLLNNPKVVIALALIAVAVVVAALLLVVLA